MPSLAEIRIIRPVCVISTQQNFFFFRQQTVQKKIFVKISQYKGFVGGRFKTIFRRKFLGFSKPAILQFLQKFTLGKKLFFLLNISSKKKKIATLILYAPIILQQQQCSMFKVANMPTFEIIQVLYLTDMKRVSLLACRMRYYTGWDNQSWTKSFFFNE
jgi:hypothetical protein